MFSTNLISNYAICFCMYFAMLRIIQLNRSNQLVDEKGCFAQNPGNLLGLQIAGILWLGLVPLIWATPILHIIMGDKNIQPVWSVSIFAVAILLMHVGTLQGKRQVVLSPPNTGLPKLFYIRYFILRIPFLVSYEIFFRGLLLFLLAEKLGIAMAILADMVLNIVLHFFSGKKMMWACIPFSLLCCVFNYQAQAVWPSIVLHLAISFSFELTIAKKLLNPLKISS